MQGFISMLSAQKNKHFDLGALLDQYGAADVLDWRGVEQGGRNCPVHATARDGAGKGKLSWSVPGGFY